MHLIVTSILFSALLFGPLVLALAAGKFVGAAVAWFAMVLTAALIAGLLVERHEK